MRSLSRYIELPPQSPLKGGLIIPPFPDSYREGVRGMLLIFLLLQYLFLPAQPSQPSTSFSNGAGRSTSNSNNTIGTVGQSLSGTFLQSNSFTVAPGFVPTIFSIAVPDAPGRANITSTDFPATYTLGSDGLNVSTTVDDAGKVANVDFFTRQIASGQSFSRTQQDITATDNTFSVNIPESAFDELGVSYFFQVTSSDNSIQESDTAFTHVAVTEASAPNIPSLSFGSSVSNYQIIAVPLELSNKTIQTVFDELWPPDNTAWRLFHYSNGNTTELTGGSRQIQTGDGYWLIIKDNTTIDVGPGTVVIATNDSPFQITLAPGWNQIGNPYNFTISWTDVLEANGNPADVGPLFGLSGSALGQTNGTMERFRGGFVNNSGSQNITINIPPDKSLIGGRTGTVILDGLKNPIDRDEWEVILNISDGEIKNSLAGVGMRMNASQQIDKFDVPSFPSPFPLPNLEFEKSDAILNRDIITSSASAVWEFELSGYQNKEFLINWDNTHFGDNEKQLLLVDINQFKVIDMREINSIRVNPTFSKKFKIVYGSEDFVNSRSLFPENGLLNPYPNPTNQNLTIPVFLSDLGFKYNLSVIFYDITGKNNLTLYKEALDPGYHEINWNKPVNFKPGVYQLILSIQSNGFSTKHTSKIIIN